MVVFVLGLVIGQNLIQNEPDSNLPTTSALKTVDLIHDPPPQSWISKEGLPGNSFQTAVPLDPGLDTQGTLSSDNILDFYSFTINSPSKVIINTSNLPKTFAWAVYDQQFQEVADTTRSGTSEGSSTLVLQNPGKYYIKVATSYTDNSNYPYSIRLSILPFFD